jgi:hypothetical protein
MIIGKVISTYLNEEGALIANVSLNRK